MRYFEITPKLAMAPVLEEYLAAYLMHSDVHVKRTAARSLGRYGSPLALGPLWGAFRYFHDYWKDKPAELAANGEGAQLETELRDAIARGPNWLATDTDLRLIESLCVSGQCVDATRADLSAWSGPLRLDLTSSSGSVGGVVAQYYRLPTIDDVNAKLSQFPRGTRFVLRASGPAARKAAASVRDLAIQRGLIVSEAPSPAR